MQRKMRGTALRTESRRGKPRRLFFRARFVDPGTPSELADLIKTGLAARGELVKAANIRAE
jgi:hypothetical protein